MRHSNELRLWLDDLIVNPANHIVRGIRTVVLHPIFGKTCFRIDLLVPSLPECTAVVAVHGRAYEQNTRQRGFGNLHSWNIPVVTNGSAAMDSKYSPYPLFRIGCANAESWSLVM